MNAATVRYAKTLGGFVAYQVYGDGPIDLLFVPDWGSCLETLLEHPSSATLVRRLSSIGRLMVFDKRGHGVSDPLPSRRTPLIESGVEDCLAVMDACGSSRAAIIANGHAGAVGVVFAATYPERTRALVLVNSFARFLRADDYPIGLPAESMPVLLSLNERTHGTGQALGLVAPSLANDGAAMKWYGRLQRLSQGPEESTTGLGRYLLLADVRSVLPTVSVPTGVIHRQDCRYARVAHAHYLAENIRGSSLSLLPGDSFTPYLGDTDGLASEIENFLLGVRETGPTDRVLSTVLFSDIVGSTKMAAEAGDKAWRSVLDNHDALAAREISRHRGHLIKSTGDGVLATFEGPARAISCAREMREGMRTIDLHIRTGIHTGEIELRGDDVGGMAVHIAARVASGAEADEILVSQTVADLVVGSGIALEDRGSRELKGVPGTWRLLAVADHAAP